MAREGGLLKPVENYWIQRCTSAGMAREGGKEGGLLKPVKTFFLLDSEMHLLRHGKGRWFAETRKKDVFLDSERHLRPKEEAQRERAASSADGATP